MASTRSACAARDTPGCVIHTALCQWYVLCSVLVTGCFNRWHCYVWIKIHLRKIDDEVYCSTNTERPVDVMRMGNNDSKLSNKSTSFRGRAMASRVNPLPPSR